MPDSRDSFDLPRDHAVGSGDLVYALFAAHGGCGASTVAALLDTAVEMGPDDALVTGWMPVVVCRSTTHGAASACELVSCWPDEAPRPWLVVVADAPLRPPRSARFYLRAMRDRVAGTARVPYLHQLRSAVSTREALNDPAVARAARHLRLHLSTTQSATTPSASGWAPPAATEPTRVISPSRREVS